jgi:acetyl esterase/lipase
MDENMKRLSEEWKKEMAADPGVPLWDKGRTPAYKAELDQPEPSIVPFLLPQAETFRGAVIVCAGGGMAIKAPHEGRPLAKWLNSLGIAAFVLDYRLNPYTYWDILEDAKRAVRFVRHHAAEWRIDPEKIGLLGFSAGGQLAAGVSTLFDEGNADLTDPVERNSSRPNAQVLCYPGISFMGIEKHEASIELISRFSGPEADMEDVRRASAELNVRCNTPPAFLWGTCDDFLFDQWPLYIKALKEKAIPFEVHIFPNGPHGMGMALEHLAASQWTELCGKWLKALGF